MKSLLTILSVITLTYSVESFATCRAVGLDLKDGVDYGTACNATAKTCEEAEKSIEDRGCFVIKVVEKKFMVNLSLNLKNNDA